jgi:hypothetical protein
LAKLTKIVAAERQLEAAFFLMLNDVSPEAVHTLVSAVRGILYGLSKHEENAILKKWDESVLARVVGPDKKEIRKWQNDIANFLKHADRDPNAELSVPDLRSVNEMDLLLCIIALGSITRAFSRRLNWAIWFLSLSKNSLISFESLLEEFGGQAAQLELLRTADRIVVVDALIKLYLLENSASSGSAH